MLVVLIRVVVSPKIQKHAGVALDTFFHTATGSGDTDERTLRGNTNRQTFTVELKKKK